MKLLARDISYTYLCNRIRQLWSLQGEFQALDLDNGYYCVRFSNKSDYFHVLTNGPWIIAGHYLTIRRWSPGFRSEEGTVDSVLPGMPLEFYDQVVLTSIGNAIGRMEKIDRTKADIFRGKFARLCVEVDLRKPLVPKVFISGLWQKVEDEGIRMVFFQCGRFGHNIEVCTAKNLDQATKNKDKDLNREEQDNNWNKKYENQKFGPWMIARKNYRKPLSSRVRIVEKETTTQKTSNIGSRFTVLEEDPSYVDNKVVVPESLEHNTSGNNVANKKQQMVGGKNKEELKKSLQSVV